MLTAHYLLYLPPTAQSPATHAEIVAVALSSRAPKPTHRCSDLADGPAALDACSLRLSEVSGEGRHEFDFIFGCWRIRNRRLVDLTDPSCEEWTEFDASSEAFPVLEGFGHIDRMYVREGGAADPFEGFTLRLFDPQSGLWKIWWSSTRAPGVLDRPVEGRFLDRKGIFECEDEIGGREVAVRFEWLVDDPEAPRWQQSFSYDGGRTWKLNWMMALSRTD